jgi:hypothetical protein
MSFIVAGATPEGIGICRGLWTLEVPDHALGRAVERSRLPDPGSIIREAHENLLELPANVIVDRPNFFDCEAPGLYVKPDPVASLVTSSSAATRTAISAPTSASRPG